MNIDINDLTLGQLKEIQNLSNSNSGSQSELIGKVVLVRTYTAGVHMGTLKKQDGDTVLLSNANRLWKWSDAFTLSEVATKGIGSDSIVSCKVPLIELTRIEIIPMSDNAISKVLDNVE